MQSIVENFTSCSTWKQEVIHGYFIFLTPEQGKKVSYTLCTNLLNLVETQKNIELYSSILIFLSMLPETRNENSQVSYIYSFGLF